MHTVAHPHTSHYFTTALTTTARRPPLRHQPTDGLMVPLENHNVKVVSMGLFTDGDAPVVWRGPMATKALDRLLFGTDWGPLDALVIDMPPGTGDAQITLGQRLPLSGAVIVSTPQDVALLDARCGVGIVGRGWGGAGGEGCAV